MRDGLYLYQLSINNFQLGGALVLLMFWYKYLSFPTTTIIAHVLSSVVQLAAALSLSNMVVIVGGSSADVFFMNCQSLETGWLLAHYQWYYTLTSLRLTGETTGCTLILYVWVGSLCEISFVYTVFCFERMWGGSWKNTRLYVSLSLPLITAGSPCDLGFLHPVSYRTEFLESEKCFHC